MQLEEAVGKYGAVLFRYCCGVLCDYHDAQDAVQETFIKAYTKKAAYRRDTNFGGWLYRIAYNTCISLLRKKRFRLLAGGEEAREKADGYTGNPPEGRFLSKELVEALLTLSPEERALLFNRALDDLDYRQLAKIHNASEAALRKRYERARKKMQERLSPNAYEGSGTLCINIR
jgi:RNA polymerase sigma-70 factor (ECF subfamily)